jgi:hypothetical protein
MTTDRILTFSTIAPIVLALGLYMTAGCVVDVSLEGTRLVCSDGQCPDGFECIDSRCVPLGELLGPDAGGRQDASALPDARIEPPDAAPPLDGAAPDGAPPDSAPPPDAPPLSCSDRYGGVPGFFLCGEQASTCEFFAFSEGSVTCAARCEPGGGACLAGFAAEPTNACQRIVDIGCNTASPSSICICTR